MYSRWDPGTYTGQVRRRATPGSDRHQHRTGTHAADFVDRRGPRARAGAARRRRSRATRSSCRPARPASCSDGGDFGFRALTAAQCSDLDPQSQADARALKTALFPNSASPCYEFRTPAAYDIPSETRSEAPLDGAPARRRGMSFESLILTRNQLWSLGARLRRRRRSRARSASRRRRARSWTRPAGST